ncbi:Vesicle-associated membrane 7 [Brachionus plicatilis]|uniref:5'-deoxynucleotidase HDDC2 n=1 Tax=Brachionus plicatilis TaxID=10195 RepID=A0A3M7RGT3_BRAPC|nr:Vesicle-associated membrane 7 [Brachionus plicatilis]
MSRNLIHPSSSFSFEQNVHDGKIFFVAIIRNDETLVKHSQLNGNYDDILDQVLSKFVRTNGVRMTFNYENFCFHYIYNNTITYFCITKNVFSKYKAFQFLEEIKTRFESQYQKRLHTALPFAFQTEFLPTLAIETKRFSENLSFDKLNEVERNVTETKSILTQNLDKLTDRGEKLHLLVDKTDRLCDTSISFKTTTLILLGFRTYRSGWILRGIKEPESIADHMYRMSMMAFLAPNNLDRSKCIEMCLIHDLAESIVGDITPQDNIPKEQKSILEKQAFQKLQSFIKENSSSDRFNQLVEEYSSHSSAEAKYVKNLDLFDMYLQAYEYEILNDAKLDEFFSSIDSINFEPNLKEIIEELMNIRNKGLNFLPKDSNLNTILKFYLPINKLK